VFDLTAVAPRTADEAPAIAMPLGGIGTGSVAVSSDGSLRQWQLRGHGAHRAHVPGFLLALRAIEADHPVSSTIRLLQTPPASDPRPGSLTSDAEVPEELHDRSRRLPLFASGSFRTAYPVAELDLADPDVGLAVRWQAFTPFVPLDVEASSWPVVLWELELTNPDERPVHGWLGIAAQNQIGWDGVSPIRGVENAGYGGNVNRAELADGVTTLTFENPSLAPDDPRAGQVAIGTDASGAQLLSQYIHDEEFLTFLEGRYVLDHLAGAEVPERAAGPSWPGVIGASGPSGPGRTWNGGIAVPFRLDPRERVTVRFALTWRFPNRYADFPQFGRDFGPSRLWLGNHYATVHRDAADIARRAFAAWDRLAAGTARWLSTMLDNDLPAAWREHIAAIPSALRTPVVFRDEDGHVYGFEGLQGASTGNWSDNGGSCPLNCTHVWNYEQAMAQLFPTLERDMRDTEFDVMQAPDGSLPHRVIVPRWIRQPWDEPIGGPVEAALDGMLGLPLKTLREVRRGWPLDQLRRRWPAVTRLMDHVLTTWGDAAGLPHGPQPSTFDVPVHGANPYIAGLWLCALRATEELARLVDDEGWRHRCRDLFVRGSEAGDRIMFDGSFFRQVLGPDDPVANSWGGGILSDQLVGQWWAHQLELGPLWPEDHVRSALEAIIRHNLRDEMGHHARGQRAFAADDEPGLINCTWPAGGRPAHPIAYCDEVWTGVEYQVAAHCLMEGMDAHATAVLDRLFARYDGRRRNPYNHIECGDHYVRALAGFSLLDATTGLRWNAASGTLTLPDGARHGRLPFVASEGWGVVAHDEDRLRLRVDGGALRVARVVVGGRVVATDVTASAGDAIELPLL
jgi:hypothetical protein